MENNINKNKNKKTVDSSLGGAGGGTLIVFIAQNMQESFMQKLLFFVAPTIAVLWGFVWDKIKKRANTYYNEKEFLSTVNQAKSYISNQLKNPTLSPEHKAELEEAHSQLDLITISVYKKRLEKGFA